MPVDTSAKISGRATVVQLLENHYKKKPTTPPVMLKTCVLSSGPMSCPEEFNVTCADSETFLSQGIEGIRFVWGGGGIPRHIFDDFLCKSKKKIMELLRGAYAPPLPSGSLSL